MNKKEKNRLLELMGEKVEDAQDSENSDSSDDEAKVLKAEESEESDSEEEQLQSGYDGLQAPGSLDIPRAGDIPIVAKLAKVSEKDKMANMTGEEQLAYKK